MDWAESAEESGTPLDFEVSIAIPRQLERITSSRAELEVVIIDTPPGDEPSINATLQVSDFIIIPAAPRGPGMAQLGEVIDVLGQTPYAAVLTQVLAGKS